MARKRNAAPDGVPPEPDAVPAVPKVVDMPVRDLLQMLGQPLPESAPLQPRAAPSLPTEINSEAKIGDLTVGELLGLLAALRG
jgi:hypothetical protein